MSSTIYQLLIQMCGYCRQIWQWITLDGSSSDLRGAGLVCWEIIKSLSSALAVSWRQGGRLAVEAAFVCLADVATNHGASSLLEHQACSIPCLQQILQLSCLGNLTCRSHADSHPKMIPTPLKPCLLHTAQLDIVGLNLQ